MMIKTDVSNLYKTKLCKKYSANGYCPYGMRCQFIHDINEAQPTEKKADPVKAPEFVPNAPATSSLSINSEAFKADPATQYKVLQDQPLAKATNKGGFGNQQTSLAFAAPKIVYRDTLVHCMHVSIQEYQKKLKMYQKKVSKKLF